MQARRFASYFGVLAAAGSSIATSAPEPDWTITSTPFEQVVTLTESAPNGRCDATVTATHDPNVSVTVTWTETTHPTGADLVDVKIRGNPSGTTLIAPTSERPAPEATVNMGKNAGAHPIEIELSAGRRTRLPVSITCRYRASISGDGDQPSDASVRVSAP